MQFLEKVPPKNRLPAQRLTIESARAAQKTKATGVCTSDFPSQTLAAPCAERDAQIVRVTTQYWKGDTRVCELECDGRVLDVHMSGPNEGPWIAEAHSDHTVEAFVIVGTGTSRSAALLAVAAAWRERAPMVGLRAFDWEAIAEALRGVNACD